MNEIMEIMNYLPWILFLGITVLGTIRDSFKMGFSVAVVYILMYYAVPAILGFMGIGIPDWIMLIFGVLVLITLIKK